MQETGSQEFDSHWNILRDTAILSGVGSLFTFIKPLRAVVLGRVLGPYAYGLLNIPLPYVQILSIFANMGLSAAVLRIVSVKLGRRDPASAKAVYRTGIAASFASSLIWSLLLCAFAPTIASRFAGEPRAITLIIVAAWMIPGITLTAVLSNTFLAFSKGAELGLIKTIYSLISLVLPVAFVLAFDEPSYVLLGFVLAEISGAGIALGRLRKTIEAGFPSNSGIGSPQLGPLLKLSHSFFYTNLGWMLINSVDRIMIQRYCQTEILGFYAVAVFFVNFLNIIPMNFAQVLTPSLTRAIAGNEMENAWQTLKSTTRIVSMILAPLVIFTAVFSIEMVTLLFSESFAAAGIYLKILSFVALLNFICKLTWSVLISESNPGKKSLAYIFAAAVNIAFNVLLIPRYGAPGAAWASLISFVLLAAVLQVLLFAKTAKIFPFGKIIPAFLSAFVASQAACLLLHPLQPVPRLFAGLIVSSILYISILLAAKIIKEDDLEGISARAETAPGGISVALRLAEKILRPFVRK